MKPSPPTIATLIQQATEQLQLTSDSPLLDVQLLLSHALNKDRSYLLGWPEVTPDQQAYEQFGSYLERRKEGEPVAYILGFKEFWSMPLKVTPDVLIPRPETELLVEQVLIATAHLRQPRILELGTGSGAIAIALAKELPKAHVIATDNSDPALDIARQNAANQSIETITFLHSDWFFNVLSSRFDIIVTNPPYIEKEDPHLEGSIQYEPKQALVSGEDGLDDIRMIIRESVNHLHKTGQLLIEHGYNQGSKVRELMHTSGFAHCTTMKDFAKNDRVTGGIYS